MSQSTDKALLPAGLTDGLPPAAGFDAATRESLVASFVSRGFDRVAPPLVEFEDNLLTGTGAAMSSQTFRLMDPVSQRMMGLRADITPQVARIATTRLGHRPRPLRLCYAGEVLRIRGTQLRPERQFTQAGAEIIGTDSPRADAEMVVMAVTALNDLGISDIKVDLGQPTLVPAIMAERGIVGETAQNLRSSLDKKDAAAVQSLVDSIGHTDGAILTDLLSASGPLASVAPQLQALALDGDAAKARDALLTTASLITEHIPELDITLDAVENRGFEYHTGATFTLFAPGVRGELGNGGRYIAGQNSGEPGEHATGFTLFLDSILRAISAPEQRPSVYVPVGTTQEKISALHGEGYRTVQGHEERESESEAARLACSHVLTDGSVRPQSDE